MKALPALVLVLAACTAPQPPPGAAGPVEAVQSFADAVRKGDTATAWSLLSKRTQQQANELSAAARSASDAGPESGRQMLFSGALPGGELEAKKVSQEGDTAEVETTGGAGSAGKKWHLVHEGGRWRVDLDLRR